MGAGAAWWLRAAGIGVAAGILSGLFGVGGGIIMVPMLIAWFALDQRRAGATSLLAIIPIATASTIGYAVNGNVDAASGLLLLVGGIVGGQVGARLLPRTSIPTLQLWFGVLSLATAVRLVLDDPASGGGWASGALESVLLLAVGLAAGVLAGLLGVGGGIIMVPGLVGAPAGLAGAALGQWLPQRLALALFAGLLAWSGIRMLVRSRAGRRVP